MIDVYKVLNIRVAYVGYDGAEYRAQLNEKNQKKRYPVVTLVLYFGCEKDGQEGAGIQNMCEVLDRIEARGIEKGIEKGIKTMAMNLYAKGMDVENIAAVAEVSPEVVKNWIEELNK